MRRLNPCLLLVTLVFAVMHVGYFVSERVEKPLGAYFASGVLLLSTGKALRIDARLQFQDDGVHDYQQYEEWSRNAFRKTKNSLWGSLRLVTESAQVSPRRVLDNAPGDNDLAFAHAYYIKKGTPFTLYRLPSSPKNMCFYIRELSGLRCLSMERPKGV